MVLTTVGKNAFVFSLLDHDSEMVSLDSFLGKWVVLYFYGQTRK